MSVTSIARKIPEPALAKAIEAAAEARSAVEQHQNAIERALHLVSAARRKADAASKAVATARDEDAQALAAAIITGRTVSPQATVRARELEIEAGDAVAMARSAYERLESDLKAVEQDVVKTDKAVRAVISAMLAPVAERMRAEAQHLRAEYLKRQHAIDAMADRLDGFKRLDFSVRDDEYRELCVTVRAPWVGYIDALERGDVDADPPDVGD